MSRSTDGVTPRQPFEPELVHIPAGEFVMGGDPTAGDDDGYLGQPRHTVYLPGYALARTPVTNTQYLPFVRATGHHMPDHWEGGRPLEGMEHHPMVFVSWYDARAYCAWLSEVTGRSFCLPSEAEWEKGARGPLTPDKGPRSGCGRLYPWGDEWDATRCNTAEGGMEGTTPVGAYPRGASPCGLLDMAGNVWEWTSSARRPYPYDPGDGREDPDGEEGVRRVVRGGSFLLDRRYARCAVRYGSAPDRRTWIYGFRVCVVAQ